MLTYSDEAHRIRNSSNFMTDRGNVGTYLTQVMSLLYCSKICVFFIDDHQGINKEEIGSSLAIRDAAENYSKRIKDETADFIIELEDNRKKYSKTEKEISALSDKQAVLTIDEYTYRYDKLKKRLIKYQKMIAKEYQLSDIKTSVSEVEIRTIELVSQFRCNGSDNYLDWLDTVLYDDMNTVKARKISFLDIF